MFDPSIAQHKSKFFYTIRTLTYVSLLIMYTKLCDGCSKKRNRIYKTNWELGLINLNPSRYMRTLKFISFPSSLDEACVWVEVYSCLSKIFEFVSCIKKKESMFEQSYFSQQHHNISLADFRKGVFDTGEADKQTLASFLEASRSRNGFHSQLRKYKKCYNCDRNANRMRYMIIVS